MEDKKISGKNLNEQMNMPSKYSVSPLGNGVPKETLEKADKVKEELEEFKKKVVKKFPFIHSLSVLPAQSFKLFEEDEGLLPEEVEKKPLHLMMLIPETQFKNISKKIKPEILKIVKDVKEEVWVHIKTEVDLWNYGLDSKYEFIDAIANSFPLYDKGLLGNVRLANIHKSLVMRKFEKYVASYIIGGSLVRGTADKTSDVDTFVIIDDTDVKRMPRLQLLEKLRGMIYDYIREANALAGVKNPLNVQVYLLTDFWDSVKDANPVMFTFIRDGVPMHDRGTFLPWKLLLQMGKIKPSPEAVDKFMKSGDQTEALLKRRMMDGMVDIYWGVVTPTQALMMLAGHAPPAPKTLVQDVKKVLVDKEKIMGIKELNYLEKVVKLFKDYEHGKLKEISGTEVDKLFKESLEFDKKIKEMRKKLESSLVVTDADRIYNEVFDLLKKIFGNKSRDILIKIFENELVKKAKFQSRFVPVLKDIVRLKQKVKTGKVTTLEMNKLRSNSTELIRELIDYSQRADIVSSEKSVIFIKFGDKKGELVYTGEGYFFVESGRVMKVGKDKFILSHEKDLASAISKSKDEVSFSLGSEVLNVLKKELGNFEIVF